MNRLALAAAVLAVACVASTAVLASSHSAPERRADTASSSTNPPLLPSWFTADFEEWTAINAPNPPYVNGVPPGPQGPNLYRTSGRTYYDWTTVPYPQMIEQRDQYCVNIFPTFSNNFSCTFQNVGGATYLISQGTTNLPPCCVFGDPWLPPPPNFLRNRTKAVVNATSVAWKGRWPTDQALWFWVPSIAPPTGPFFYAFTQVESQPKVVLPFTAIYDAFAFPGINGWVEQNFVNKKWQKPSAATWQLPPQCLPTTALPNCGFFGVDASKYRPFGFHDAPGILRHDKK